jgi:exopolysaccharide production protein ExoZ
MTQRSGAEIIVPIQVLRAVAALAVTIIHCQADLIRFGGWKAEPTPVLQTLGGAGVELFFVISGFIMVYASERLFGRADGPWIFFTHRVIRIVPLYWFVTTIYLALILLVPAFEKGYPAAFIAASYLFIPMARPDGVMEPLVGQGWTLNYEMLFYVIFAMTVFASRRAAVAIASLVLVGAIVVGQIYAPLPPLLHTWTQPILFHFVIGMAIGLAYCEGARLPAFPSWVLMIAGAVLALRLPGLPDFGWGIPFALLVAGATFGRFSPRGPVWHWLSVIGSASYALYLFHAITSRAVVFTLLWLGLDVSRAPLLYHAMAVVAATVAAVAIYYVFERPVTRALRRLAPAPASRSSELPVPPEPGAEVVPLRKIAS